MELSQSLPLAATSCQSVVKPLSDAGIGFTLQTNMITNNKNGKFNRFSDRVNEILVKREEGRLSRWMDNQDVCQQLRISPRTLQTLRDNGTLAYSQIGHKIFYKPEDVLRIVQLVEDRRKDATYRGKTI